MTELEIQQAVQAIAAQITAGSKDAADAAALANVLSKAALRAESDLRQAAEAFKDQLVAADRNAKGK